MPAFSGLPIACDLGALSPDERRREQALLAEFKTIFRGPQEMEDGYRFVIPDDSGVLAKIGEFLALERLCCPFLNFDLAVFADGGPITLRVYGEAAAKPFIRSAFLG